MVENPGVTEIWPDVAPSTWSFRVGGVVQLPVVAQVMVVLPPEVTVVGDALNAVAAHGWQTPIWRHVARLRFRLLHCWSQLELVEQLVVQRAGSTTLTLTVRTA